MAVNGYFFNAIQNNGVYDRVYSAEDFSNYLDQIVGNGVFPNPSTQLQVRGGTGMQVIVGSGQGWIYGHKLVNTADLPLTVANSDVLLNRIDRVIFYADFINREMGIDILQGTAAAQPTAPQLTRNANRYEMWLAEITVNKQTTTITQAMITDTRADSTVCGWVQGLIQQADTSTLFTQWQTAYSNYYNTSTTDFENWKDTQQSEFVSWENSIQSQFENWLSTLTQDLKVNTYIQQYKKFVQLTASSSKIIPLDMTGYTYEESDILFVIINGLVAAENVDYLLDTRQTPPEIHVNLVGSANVTDEVEIRVLKSIIGIRTTD